MLAACAALTVALLARGALAQGPPNTAPVIFDAGAWAAHFESWVTQILLRPELDAARKSLPAAPPDVVLAVLTDLVRASVESADRPEPFPAQFIPGLSTRELSGKALEAARLAAGSGPDAALAVLGTPDVLADPDAAHLRAQLIDEAARAELAADRLAAVDAYRFALSLSRGTEVAARARVRIAQIYLEIGFLVESGAALRPYLDPALPAPYDLLAQLTFAEAAFRARRYDEAAAAFGAVSPARLEAMVLPWWVHRLGDSYFLQKQYAKAAETYRTKLPAAAAKNAREFDALRTLRLAYALLRSGKADEARRELDTALDLAPHDPLAPRLALLRVQVGAERAEFNKMVDAAEQLLSSYADTEAATLAAIFWIEGRKQRHERIELPPVIQRKLDPLTSSPAVGLLTWQALEVSPAAEQPSSLRVLGQLARRLPPGPVRQLVHGSVAERLLARIAAQAQSGDAPGAELLDTISSELDPHSLDENALLVALEALHDGRRFATCQSWAAVLREREVRPLRRGLGAWREMQCMRQRSGQTLTVNRLMVLAESGALGPFSLAFAALGAETLLRRGELERGLGVYERALESVAEPHIMGPVLLRTGELHAAAGRDSVALRRLVRGLTVTDSQATVADPFRKAGIVVLADVARRSRKTLRFAASLQRDLPRVDDPWWHSAYEYLGYRIGLDMRPQGETLFARGAAQLESANRFAAQLRTTAGLPSAPAPAVRGPDNLSPIAESLADRAAQGQP